jgi:N-formylglutamate amidohydrolase
MNLRIFIAIPHAGTAVPAELKARLKSNLGAPHLLAQSDAYTDRVFQDLGAPTQVFPWSRLLIDANRSPEQLDASGAVPGVDFDMNELYQRGKHPRKPERSNLVKAYHGPYHRSLALALEQGRVGLFIDAHSMAQCAPARSPDAGKQRPLAILGNGGDERGELSPDQRPLSCSPGFARRAQHLFQKALAAETCPPAPGLLSPSGEVVLNRVFRGGYSLRHHSKPEHQRKGLQLELNQGLWCDAQSFSLDEQRLAWMRRVLRRWLEALSA